MSRYVVDDLESGLRNLKDILSVACCLQIELSPGQYDSRVSSLLWVADDLAGAVYRFHEMTPEERAQERAR